MITLESFIRDLTEEKNKMLEELAVLNGRREQLRDDINHINFALAQVKRQTGGDSDE